LKLHGSDFAYSDFADQQKLLAGRDVRVVVDVGANIGNTVAVYAGLFPAAEVYALEPYPPVYEKLAERFRENPRVHPFSLALGAARKQAQLHVNEYVDTNSLLPRPIESRRYYAADNRPRGTALVNITTLDSFAAEQGFQHIDILKLDIQGGEGNALRGGQTLLRTGRVSVIFSEVFFVAHYQDALLFHELTAFLAGFGFSLFNLCHLTFGRNGQLRFADAVYVNAEFRRTVIDASPEEA
jgi:FkbM family methyltransferase